MAENPALHEGRRGKKVIDGIYDYFREAERRKLTGETPTQAPYLPAEAIDYLRMNLELTPNEYMDTSRDVFETAMAYQNARARGIEKAREEHREREKKQKQSAERLKQKTG